MESITGVFFFLIFIRAINLSLQMKFPINKPYTLIALTIILLEFTKIQVGIFNLGTAVRHRITIYLLTAFILMTISKVREHNKTSRKLKNIQNNMIIKT